MALPFSYEGKRVVVSGGGGAGMGAAAVEGLAELGAEIHVLDLKDPPVEVASHQIVDLRDPDAVAAAIDNDRRADRRLFNAAGLPGPPFPDVDTMLVNFAAPRHLTSLVVPYMTERRRDLQHLVDRRQRLPAQPGEVDAAGRHQGLRRGEGVVRGAPRRHRGRVPAVEGGADHLDDEGGDGPQRAGHPPQLHQPRPHRHADDAGVRGPGRRRSDHRPVRPGSRSSLDARPSRAGR